jgi:hypothetical protein
VFAHPVGDRLGAVYAHTRHPAPPTRPRRNIKARKSPNVTSCSAFRAAVVRGRIHMAMVCSGLGVAGGASAI